MTARNLLFCRTPESTKFLEGGPPRLKAVVTQRSVRLGELPDGGPEDNTGSSTERGVAALGALFGRKQIQSVNRV